MGWEMQGPSCSEEEWAQLKQEGCPAQHPGTQLISNNWCCNGVNETFCQHHFPWFSWGGNYIL